MTNEKIRELLALHEPLVADVCDAVYYDVEDRPCTLGVLCHRDPSWAASNITVLRRQLVEMARLVLEARRDLDVVTGRKRAAELRAAVAEVERDVYRAALDALGSRIDRFADLDDVVEFAREALRRGGPSTDSEEGP